MAKKFRIRKKPASPSYAEYFYVERKILFWWFRWYWDSILKTFETEEEAIATAKRHFGKEPPHPIVSVHTL